ncbi:YfiR family protein [Limnohabitans sp.]|uniref:YfiR family protein n=1 Tax=Limnohabitans sp. TaxID=1907725 RepID=UPI0037C15212
MNMSFQSLITGPKALGLRVIRCVTRPLVSCLATALGLGLALPVAAQGTGPTLDRIKAAYVYNFAKFVELPGAEEMPIRLCVVGKDDPNDRMFSLNRRIAQKREILVRKDVAMDQLKDCGMVFVGAADNRLLPQVVKQLGNAPVLVISDDRQAIDQGAHLGLLHNDDRVEFEVNLLNLQRSNLRASSQMLKLARTVVR